MVKFELNWNVDSCAGVCNEEEIDAEVVTLVNLTTSLCWRPWRAKSRFSATVTIFDPNMNTTSTTTLQHCEIFSQDRMTSLKPKGRWRRSSTRKQPLIFPLCS